MIKIIKATPDNCWLKRTEALQLRDLISDECVSFSYKDVDYLKVPGLFLAYSSEDVINLKTLKRERFSPDIEITVPYNKFNQMFLGATKYQKLLNEIVSNFPPIELTDLA